MIIGYVCNGFLVVPTWGPPYSVNPFHGAIKTCATLWKMEMQLSPFFFCNFRYFYYATNSKKEEDKDGTDN